MMSRHHVRLPDGWERGHDAKYWIKTGLTPYGLTIDEERAPGVLNWLGVDYYRPDSPHMPATPAPQPIAPDDVRVGDRVRIEYSVTIDTKPQPDGKNWSGHDFADRRFYLLSRPDPDAELIRVIERIDQHLHGVHEGTWGRAFLDALAGAGYLIEPAPRPES